MSKNIAARDANLGDIATFQDWVIEWVQPAKNGQTIQIRPTTPFRKEQAGTASPIAALDFARRIDEEKTRFGPGVTREVEASLEKKWHSQLTQSVESANISLKGKEFVITTKGSAFINSIPQEQPILPESNQDILFQAIEYSKRKRDIVSQPLIVMFNLPRKDNPMYNPHPIRKVGEAKVVLT